MIDERQEEIASLYALDALQGEERLRFEARMAGNPELQRLVLDLREATAVLARSATAEPPAELRRRVLASIDERQRGTKSAGPTPNAKLHILRSFVPWAAAAGFALLTGWFAERAITAESELALKRSEAQLADLGLKTARNLLESERIVSQKQVRNLTVQLTRRQNDLAQTLRVTTDLTDKLADEMTAGREKDAQMAELNRRLTALDRELAALSRRTGTEADMAKLKIATLASMSNNSPDTLAVAVWNPTKNEGVLTVEKMPVPAADESYELWVIEATPNAKPVSAGVFALAADGTGRVTFRPVAPVQTLAKFAVSRERKDGAASHAQPSEVILTSR